MSYKVKTEFSAVDRMTAVMSKISSKAKAMGASIGGSVKKAGEHLDKAREHMSGFGTAFAVGGAAAAAGAGMAIKTGMEFEQVLANIKAVANPTASELDAVSAAALATGSTMGFSATEVASAMEAMARQGLTTEQVIAGIGGVAAAAAADGATLDETITGLLSTMQGMGKGAGDLQHIADVMAKAGDSTAASIGSLSQSMAIFGPTAKSLGIELEPAIAQLAVLQDAGIEASSAGTTLSAVYSKLASPMGQTVKALETLGIKVADAHGNMKPPQDLMSEILRATDGIEGNVGKTAAITQLVGLESQKALQNITAAVKSGKLDKVIGDLTQNVDGYAQSVAAIKMDTTTGSVKKLSASVEELSIKLFSIKGPFRGVVDSVAEFISKNGDTVVQKMSDAMKWAEEHANGLSIALRAVAAVGGAIMLLVVSIKAVAAATALWNAVAALNPMLLIAAGIIAAIALIWQFWPEISAFFSMIWDAVVGFAKSVFDAIFGVISKVWGIYFGIWKAIFFFIVGMILKVVRAIWPTIQKYFGWVGGVVDWIKSAWNSLVGFFVSLFESIAELASAFGDTISDWAGAAADGFVAAWDFVANFFTNLWAGIVAGYDEYIAPIVEKIGDLAAGVGEFFSDTSAEGQAVMSGQASIIPPSERTATQVSRSISESTQRSEVMIKAPPGSTINGRAGQLTTVRLAQSGAQ